MSKKVPAKLAEEDKKLLQLQNVGPAFLKHLKLIGIKTVEQLRNENADELFLKFEARTGQRQDPCVWDVFAAIIHEANTGEKTSWWKWTPIRKQRAVKNTERGEDGDDWCDFSSSQVLNNGGGSSIATAEADTICGQTTASSSLDRLSSESFKLSAESLEDLVSSFDKVVAKCLRTSISLDGIVPAPRIRHLDDLVEEECGNSYFSAFLTPNYLERLANVKWSECRTRALFVDSMHYRPPRNELAESPKRRLSKPKNRNNSTSSFERDDEERNSDSESETPSRCETAEGAIDGDLHALMVSSVAEADFNEPHPMVSADDVINEIEEMMRAQDEAGDVEDGDSYFPGHHTGSSNEIAMIDDAAAAATVDSGYDISMTSSALSVLPNCSNNAEDANFNSNLTAKLKPLPLNSSNPVNGKFVAQSPQHSDEDFVQLFLAETLTEMSLQELEKHSERLEVAIRKYSDVLVEELATRDEQVDLKETRDHFVGLVMAVQRRVREICSTSSISSSNIALNAQQNPSEKKRNSPFVTTVIPYNPDAGPLPLEELRVLAKILQAMLDDSPAVPTLLTEYILTVLCAKENPRV